jgi:hypothetical protein
MTQATVTETKDLVRKTAGRLGFWVAIITTVLAVIAFVIAIATPPDIGSILQEWMRHISVCKRSIIRSP